MTVVYIALAVLALVLVVVALWTQGNRKAEPPVTRLGTLAEIKAEGWRSKQAEADAAAAATPAESEPDP